MRVIITFFVVFASFSLYAQSTRPTLHEIEMERLFIEAKQSLLLEDYEKGIKALNTLLKKDSKNSAAFFELSKAYGHLEEYSLTEKNALKAVDIAPENNTYLNYLSELYMDNSDFENASKYLEKIIEHSPSDIDAYHSLTYAYLKQNKGDKALSIYDKLEKVSGEDPQVMERKFTIYKIMEKKKEAIKEAQRLIDYDPDYIESYHLLAEYYVELEEYEESNKVYAQILELDPNDQRAQLSLAEKAYREGDKIAYLKAMNELFKNPEMDIDLKIKETVQFIGDLDLPTREKTNAEIEFREAMFTIGETLVNVHPKNAKAYSIKGDIYYYAKESRKAISAYKKTLEIDNSIFTVWENLMFLQSDIGDSKDLIQTSEEAIDVFPNQPMAYYLNGMAWSQNKNGKKAVSSLEEAKLRAGTNPGLKMNILVQLANEYNDLEEYKKSDKTFEEALALNPNNALILNNYSFFLSVRDEQLEKAEEMAIKANELEPNQVMYQDTYGWVLYKKGDFEGAKKWLKKAVDNGGDAYGEVLEHLGDAYYRLNNTSEALKYWKLASKKEDASEKIEEKISNQKIIE